MCLINRKRRAKIALEEQKVAILRKVTEALKHIQAEKDDITVEVMKGSYTARNVFRRMIKELKKGDEILYMGLDEAKMEALEPIFLKQALRVFQEKKITERIIIKPRGKTLSYAYTASYRHLPADVLGDVVKIIYHDTIIELLYSDPLYTTITKSKKIAATARAQFELFWKLAK